MSDDRSASARAGVVLAPGAGRAYPMGRISAVFKADGEEKARRYLPIGGQGGPDKNVLKAIADTPINARVKMDWRYDNRCRIVKIEVLKLPDKSQ